MNDCSRRPSRTPNRSPSRPAGRVGVCLAAAAACLVLASTPAHASVAHPEDLPEPTSGQLADSVTVYSDLEDSIRRWSLDDAVETLESEETDDGETTITLSTDILFTPDSSKLPAAAGTRIGELIAQVPKGAEVRIDGHTDSFQGAVDNQKLSKDRAQAVAAVVHKKRGDLDLTVKGHAATQPAVREDPKDPSTFAENRRVEITYSK